MSITFLTCHEAIDVLHTIPDNENAVCVAICLYAGSFGKVTNLCTHSLMHSLTYALVDRTLVDRTRVMFYVFLYILAF